MDVPLGLIHKLDFLHEALKSTQTGTQLLSTPATQTQWLDLFSGSATARQPSHKSGQLPKAWGQWEQWVHRFCTQVRHLFTLHYRLNYTVLTKSIGQKLANIVDWTILLYASCAMPSLWAILQCLWGFYFLKTDESERQTEDCNTLNAFCILACRKMLDNHTCE